MVSSKIYTRPSETVYLNILTSTCLLGILPDNETINSHWPDPVTARTWLNGYQRLRHDDCCNPRPSAVKKNAELVLETFFIPLDLKRCCVEQVV